MRRIIRYAKMNAHTLLFVLVLTVFSISAQPTQAQTQGRAVFFLSPQNLSVLTGSTFDVSIFLDTKGANISTIEVDLKFPSDIMSIVEPSGGVSLISIWDEPATYSNTLGEARFAGRILDGITVKDGLITTLTFKAKKAGKAVVEILPTSKITANDGLESKLSLDLGKGFYDVRLRPPEGIQVFSETHPFEQVWYNNNSPILRWQGEADVDEFSFILDSKPQTIPDNIADSRETILAYEKLEDGLWYFHIKAKKDGIWQGTTHFSLRIDTEPPESFEPVVEILTAGLTGRAFVAFDTYDTLSSVDYYEVGVINKDDPPTKSPLYIQAQSPYQIPRTVSGNLRISVRAVDNAGNTQDESIDVNVEQGIVGFLKRWQGILLTATLLLFIAVHLILRHNILYKLGIFLERLDKKDERDQSQTLS